jgi:hypothetical protein
LLALLVQVTALETQRARRLRHAVTVGENFAHGRHVHVAIGQEQQPLEQTLAERSVLDQPIEVAARHHDDTGVDDDWPVRADAFELAFPHTVSTA